MKNKNNLFENGAQWVKADLHLHSPFVHSFKLPQNINLNDVDTLVGLYVNKLVEKEIKIAAITDYQQIREEFFSKLQKEAKQRDIYIFPGIELSINYGGKGLHILLIFKYDEKVSGINDYIKSLDQEPQKPLINKDRSHRDITLQVDLKIVLEKIKSQFECLVIFPHPVDENGLLKSSQSKVVAELLKYADAVELIDERNKNNLISTGILNKSFFNTLAIIENTDPKSLDNIGSKHRDPKSNDEIDSKNSDPKLRTTFLKLSFPSINAIKIALHDPLLRVSIYEKPDIKKDKIKTVKINGTSFLKNINVELNSDLNTFIGGRGVGKSAILEAIRYCLDLPVYSDLEYMENFVESVVGSGGTIELEIDKVFGNKIINHKIKRVIGQLPEVVGRNIPPKELFEDKIPLILGQKELYNLSLKDDFQLSLIDNMIGSEIKKAEIELKKILQQLEENGQQLLMLKKQIQKKDEIEQEFKTINEHLKTFQELGVADKMALHTALIRDENKLVRATEVLKSQISNYKTSLNETISEIERQMQLLQKGDSNKKEILENIAEIFLDIKQYFDQVKQNFESSVKNYEQKIQEQKNKWYKQKKEYDDEINNIKRELDSKRLKPDKYEELVKQKTQLEPLLTEYNKIDSDITKLKDKRAKLKNELKEKRHQLFEIRKNKLEEINEKFNGKLKIEIEYLNDKEKFKEELIKLLKGSSISKEVVNNIIIKNAINGIELSKSFGLGELKVKEAFELTDAMSKKLIEWFKDDERLFALENLLPDDRIIIKLKIEDTYKELNSLSAGQRATALLILLFAQEDRILIIDQPEEDLDNRFIYEDVVKMLREIKTNRQIVLATHNANIPVLGDSDQVLVLEASDNKCTIIDKGSIDKTSIAQQIKSIMEGGEEAFKKRIEKYGVKL